MNNEKEAEIDFVKLIKALNDSGHTLDDFDKAVRLLRESEGEKKDEA